METCYMDEIVELYKTILEQETANHNTFIWVLLGITTVLLGVTWWWNKAGANRYIKNTIDRKIKEKDAEIEKKVEEMVKEKMDAEIDTIEKKFMHLQVDISRSIAISAYQAKKYSRCVVWSAQTIKFLIETDGGSLIRTMVDIIIECFEKMGKEREVFQKEVVVEIINKLPGALSIEQKKIMKYLEDSKDVDAK